VTTDGGTTWVANGAGTVTQLDSARLKVAGRVGLGESFNCGPIAAGEGAMWVLAEDAVVRLTPDGLRRDLRRATATACAGNAIATGWGAVWVTNQYPSRVVRIDPRAVKITADIPLSFLPVDMALDATGVWIADRRGGAVVRVDPRANDVAGTVKVGRNPIAIAAGVGSLWVANADGDTVTRVDPKRGTVVAKIKVGPHPTHIAAGEGGVWVTVHPD
jgi:DNA-binding beta-propeller fold protein YncE